MIDPINPSSGYDYNNEAQFRTQVRQADIQNRKKEEADASFLMIDEADGKPYRVTLSGGALVFTEVTP